MEFDFLPNLPKSNLDDRTFAELVDECLLRIPRYCPEWTNHNPSDPGMTLIELFAWLTDQMLVRFNQVPRRNYVAFLELLGVRLQPPAPARTTLTLYLAANLPEAYQIPVEVEVATERTETEEAIIFSTDRPLVIDLPKVAHLLTAERLEERPTMLRDRFSHFWDRDSEGCWRGRELEIFSERPLPGNSFYLVFEPEQAIEGNVIRLTFQGEAATATGINPEQPPRHWEAWTGEAWVPILLNEAEDRTRGFSFHEISGGAQVEIADVILHLPQQFPVSQFSTYQGRWIRCVCIQPGQGQPGYSSSPRLIGISACAIGGTVDATQCSVIRDELLGESDGLAGQSFQLQGAPVLTRHAGEHLWVIPPDGVPQQWQEVRDFAESTAADRHYVIDSLTGHLQFGPLIREPAQLRETVQSRSMQQTGRNAGVGGSTSTALADRPLPGQAAQMERQCGAVPPRGSVLRMARYRTGGGQLGNVQRHTLRVMKSAVPYVAAVTNHIPAQNGADAESLENAALRVPKLLRTRDRAVTPEDFETLSLEAGQGAIARSSCPVHSNAQATPGIVDVMLVPQANRDSIQRGEGIHPDRFSLTPQLHHQVQQYLDERRLVGIQVRLQTPTYVGVMVQTEVSLEPQYNNPQAQEHLLQALQVKLYRFLNPLTGGNDGQGWPFGKPLYPSDIITLLQGERGVRYLGSVLLYELRWQGDSWVRSLASDNVVNPGEDGLICSWADRTLRSNHVISVIG